jgi:hypothetical protein
LEPNLSENVDVMVRFKGVGMKLAIEPIPPHCGRAANSAGARIEKSGSATHFFVSGLLAYLDT